MLYHIVYGIGNIYKVHLYYYIFSLMGDIPYNSEELEMKKQMKTQPHLIFFSVSCRMKWTTWSTRDV